MTGKAADWDDVTIGDFGEIVTGGTPSRGTTSFWNGTIPWVTPGEITELKGKYLNDTREKITPAGLAGSAAKLLPVGSVVVTTRATLGEAAIAAVPLATNQGFKNIIPNEATDSLFAYYRLRSLRSEMERLASGTTFLEISKADFSRIRTHRPRVDEQERVAAVLDTVDQAIAKTEAVIAKLKQVCTGLLHDLLTRGLDEHGQVRDPIAHPEQFKDSPFGRIPREWKTSTLGELMAIISYGFTNPMPTTSDGPWMVTAFDIGDGGIRFDQARHTSQHAFDSLLADKSKPNVGDILVTKDGTLGRVALVDRSNVCINQSVAVLRPLQRTDAAFVTQFLGSPHGQHAMLSEAGGSTIKHIYITALASVLIPYPLETERRTILKTLRESDRLIISESQFLAKLLNLKSGLTADLLTGRVRVPEAIVDSDKSQ